MLRALFRLIIVVIVLVAVGAFFFGYRWGGRTSTPVFDRPIGTTGATVDTSRAREVGGDIGEKVAAGANKAEQAVSDASLTTKIKAKMALDDSVRALAIDVDTRNGVVTLSGRVASIGEHMRAVELARDTDGVLSVVDRITIGQ